MNQKSEFWVIFIISALQFINILDFMMVMPLGPDFSSDLHIPLNHLGSVAASYTLAAACSGLAGSFFLDRFDRKKSLLFFTAGLALATCLGGLAWNMTSLIAARVLAGLFGGPATSTSFSIIGDVIPLERRGKAMGIVMSSFSLASVFGVPVGLMLAQYGGWRMPFFSVGSLAFGILLLACFRLPAIHHSGAPSTSTANSSQPKFNFWIPEYLLMFTTISISMFGGFILIPNISAYLQYNLHFPRAHLDQVYAVGGIMSFFAMRLAGKSVDRHGSFPVTLAGSFILLPVLYFGFVVVPQWLPILALFVFFMVGMSVRNVSISSLGTKVPLAHERARYMSLQSFCQHLASGLAAYVSTCLLSENPDRSLNGIKSIALVSAICVIVLPVLVLQVERRLKRRAYV